MFVPAGNNPDKNMAIAALGARVITEGKDFDAAWQAAKKFAEGTGAFAVHPSCEPRLVAGYATIALEMLDQASQPLDTVFIPVGGGSLAAGMGLVFKALSPHTRVIGVQSAAAPALARAWRTGELKEFPALDTIADGLAARVPSPRAVETPAHRGRRSDRSERSADRERRSSASPRLCTSSLKAPALPRSRARFTCIVASSGNAWAWCSPVATSRRSQLLKILHGDVPRRRAPAGMDGSARSHV